MNEKIKVWISYDDYVGSYSISETPCGGMYKEAEITRRQLEALRDAKKRYYNANQFVMRALGLKNEWTNGIETDPEVDDSLLPQ